MTSVASRERTGPGLRGAGSAAPVFRRAEVGCVAGTQGSRLGAIANCLAGSVSGQCERPW